MALTRSAEAVRWNAVFVAHPKATTQGGALENELEGPELRPGHGAPRCMLVIVWLSRSFAEARTAPRRLESAVRLPLGLRRMAAAIGPAERRLVTRPRREGAGGARQPAPKHPG